MSQHRRTDAASGVTWDTVENARRYRAYTESHSSYREWSERLVELCDVRPAMTVLDLGCGTGATIDALYRAHGDAIRIVALDGSAAQLEQARAHGPSARVEYVQAAAEELARHVRAPVDRVISNAAFWQMKPAPTLAQIRQVAARACRVVFSTFPKLLSRPPDEVESVIAPSVRGKEHLLEIPGPRPTLVECMMEVARAELGAIDANTTAAEERQATRQRDYRAELEAALAESGFERVREEVIWVLTRPESTYAWYKIPIFRRNVFPALDAATSERILDAAYARWRPSAAETVTPMGNVVLELNDRS